MAVAEQIEIAFPVPTIRGVYRGYGLPYSNTDLSIDDARTRIHALLEDGDWHSKFEIFRLFDTEMDGDVRPSAIYLDAVMPMVMEGKWEERKDFCGTAEIGPGYLGYSSSWRLARNG
jgi:hypothetical protein